MHLAAPTGFALAAVFALTPLVSAQQDSDHWIESSFHIDGSMEIVEFLSARWRTRGGGNPGFDQSIDHVRGYLRSHGFEAAGTLRVIEGPLTLHPLAWDPAAASLSIEGEEPLQTLSANPTMIAKFSGSTAEGGVVAELIDVGAGDAPEHYANLDVRGKIVLARGHLGGTFKNAVTERGAIGVVSDNLRANELYATHPEMVRVGSLPVLEADELRARKTWALKIPPRVGDLLRKRLESGAVKLHVDIKTQYYDGPQRALVAEILGATLPDERIVLMAHLDNNAPGAHNNASGIATHAELARILAAAVSRGELKRPERTITFLFAAEHDGSRMYLAQSPTMADSVAVMLNGDMTGLDTENHGGIYRFERMPDPATLSPRPRADRHPEDRFSGWGFRPFSDDPYPGHYLNDLMWDVIQRQAAHAGWHVHQNPFEGGSDHDDFLVKGVAAALSWYWEDPFLSTSLDTPDKVSPLSMRNVAVVHGRVALAIASGTERDAHHVLALIEANMGRRLERERRTALRRMAASSDEDRERIVAEERKLLTLWADWYDEAARSVTALVVGASGPALDQHIEAVVTRWRAYVKALEPEIFGPKTR